jgi:hypothetical protein
MGLGTRKIAVAPWGALVVVVGAAVAVNLLTSPPDPSTLPALADPAGGEGASAEAGALGPPETFAWSAHPIRFAPPPVEWERQREQSGGLQGIRFLHAGTAITVAESSQLARRDRRDDLREMLAELEQLSSDELTSRLGKARMPTREPINWSEADAARRVNGLLDIQVDFGASRLPIQRALEQALWEADRVEYALEDVVESVRVRPAAWSSIGQAEVGEPRAGTTGGLRSETVDFTLSTPRGEGFGREVYVVSDNHLFVLKCMAKRKEHLALFDQLVASIEFPPVGQR